ncbi:hypothetical protein V5N11_011865 [Cardamine amara subsp. amara]|uniref:Plus3 domain-containing protein n=1 Tax=Cardamine amara subsp. amara TaxID=228776 RepID=A0ABD1ABZ8_CARAN
MTRDMNAAEVVELDDEAEEKECDDWCFVCKDGGELMLCDYKDCPKVYHERCIDKGIAKMDGDSLICMWHKCYLCKKGAKLQCLCCSHAVCQGCVTHAEFIRVKGNKGLCNECQELVFALEEIREYDAAGDKIDLADRDTVECLFLEYWTIIKTQEDLTFDDVRAARSQKKDVKSSYNGYAKFSLRDLHTSRKGIKMENDDDPEFSPSDDEVEVVEGSKTLSKTKGIKFIGWGSKPLIDFLTSIGEETKEALSQEYVESVIRKYIRRKNLYDQEKKKKINCDEQLHSIFRKKAVNINRIHNLLNAHFKENFDQWEDMRRLALGFGDNDSEQCKKQKTERSAEETLEKEVKPEMQATGLAMINADNIKHVYLRKSLIEEFLKQNESIGDKVVGCFVKVKNHSMDSIAFQILQVTGIKTADNQSEGVLLYVAGRESGVSITRLEDSDIKEEEITHLKEKVMNGLLRQPTVVEMEQKAKALHEEITTHWIKRQLSVLQRRISFTNEKGYRRELEEYLDQRELLEKPSEQERLLRQVPKIMEEFVEVKKEQAGAGSSGGGPSQEDVIDIED